MMTWQVVITFSWSTIHAFLFFFPTGYSIYISPSFRITSKFHPYYALTLEIKLNQTIKIESKNGFNQFKPTTTTTTPESPKRFSLFPDDLKERILIPTIVAGVAGGVIRLMPKHRRTYGVAAISSYYCTIFAVVTGYYCGCVTGAIVGPCLSLSLAAQFIAR